MREGPKTYAKPNGGDPAVQLSVSLDGAANATEVAGGEVLRRDPETTLPCVPERTLFMLDWFDDPEQRRRTGNILNKGEARNALARAIFNRLGELRDRTFENQRHRASGLTLVTAAVTLWNTVYLDRAVRHLRGAGVDVPDELLAHVAPLGWEHIGLTGDYLWSEMDKPRERFSPLRLSPADRRA